MDDEVDLWLIGGGAIVGILFGAIAQRSRFCLVAAISNMVLVKDHRNLHAYLAALGIAVLGTTILEQGQWVVVAESAYRVGPINLGGAILGGLLFGFGAMLAGGCATRTVIRVAEGNLGALLALLGFAAAGMATLYGILEPARGWLTSNTATALSNGDGSVAVLLGAPQWLVAIALAGFCLGGILFLGEFRRGAGMILAGALIGLLVTAGWWTTGYLAQDDFTELRPASVSISGPLARAGLFLLTTQTTGTHFGLALIAGIVFGALATALASRRFHWVPPDGAHVAAYLTGGMMMGVGAILAGGCNIGNGLTGASTMSCQALLAFAAILVGMRVGLGWLQRRA